MNGAGRGDGRLSPGLLARVFVPFALGYFLSYLYRAVNAVIAPDLIRDVGLGASDLGLLTSAYFLSFAAFQLPLGVLLDRIGPRKAESALLLFAAAGAFVFAAADSPGMLLAGRALIGFGVSACLMAAFKAFVQWFPMERLPLVNGLQMTAGGLGALSATAPIEAALSLTDWRGVFVVLGVVTLVVAALVRVVVPARGESRPETTLGEQLRGVGQVFTSPVFWSITPWTVASQAAFMAIQGLWAGPWLRDVAGFEREAAAGVLFLIAGAMVAGFLLSGVVAERLGRLGLPTVAVAATGMAAFMAVQAVLMSEPARGVVVLWALFGLFGTSGILSYAALSQSFAPELAGRVNTSINLLVFVGAFAAQWAIGGLIDLWPAPGPDTYAPEGYRAGFGLMLGLQAAAAAWFVLSTLRRRRVRAAR